MTEVTTPPEGSAPVNPPPDPAQTSARTDFSTLPSDVQAYIKSLRDEAKQTRLEKERVERERGQAEAARLEADKQFELLAQQRAAKIAELEPLATGFDQMRQYLTEKAEKAVAALPLQWQSAAPKYPDPKDVLQWLDDNTHLFRTQVPPNIGAGPQGDGQGGKRGTQMSATFLATQMRMRRTQAQAQASWDRLTPDQQKAAQ